MLPAHTCERARIIYVCARKYVHPLVFVLRVDQGQEKNRFTPSGRFSPPVQEVAPAYTGAAAPGLTKPVSTSISAPSGRIEPRTGFHQIARSVPERRDKRK